MEPISETKITILGLCDLQTQHEGKKCITSGHSEIQLFTNGPTATCDMSFLIHFVAQNPFLVSSMPF